MAHGLSLCVCFSLSVYYCPFLALNTIVPSSLKLIVGPCSIHSVPNEGPQLAIAQDWRPDDFDHGEKGQDVAGRVDYFLSRLMATESPQYRPSTKKRYKAQSKKRRCTEDSKQSTHIQGGGVECCGSAAYVLEVAWILLLTPVNDDDPQLLGFIERTSRCACSSIADCV